MVNHQKQQITQLQTLVTASKTNQTEENEGKLNFALTDFPNIGPPVLPY